MNKMFFLADNILNKVKLPMTVPDALGWIGAVLFLLIYVFIVLDKVHKDSALYHSLNLLAACCMFTNAYAGQMYAFVFLNFCWGLLSLFCIFRVWWRAGK